MGSMPFDDVMVHRQRSGRLVLILLALLCAAPVLSAWWIIRVSPPAGGTSYGMLLPTRPFPPAAAPGWPAGKWVLVTREEASCPAACQSLRHTVRQLRTALGEGASRTAIVHLVEGRSPVKAREELSLVAEGATLDQGHFLLVDPLGNQVMSYPADADPKRVIRELGHVLKTNNGLG